MPTGYTAKLCDKEVSFKEFVLTCSRAFGALVMVRDDPHDKPIPKRFEPSKYAEEALARAEDKLQRIEGMSDKQIMAFQAAENKKHLKLQRNYEKKAVAIRGRLLAMRAKVCEWTPPTPEHNDLKKFMLEQIDMTIKQDGTAGTYYQDLVTGRNAREWRRGRIASAQKYILYYKKQQAEKIKRTDSRNAWIEDLRGSLK